MKKVLLISYENIYAFGGQENYNYQLAKIFLELGWEVHYFGLYERENISNINQPINIQINIGEKINDNSKLSLIRMSKLNKGNIKKLKNYLENNKFDLIVDSLLFTWKKFSLNEVNNKIWIQHQSLQLLDYSAVLPNMLSKFIYKLWKLLTGFYANVENYKNAVFFTMFDRNEIIKRFNLDIKNAFVVPLFSEVSNSSFDYFNKKKAIIWFGRIDKHQKRINFLIKLSKYLNLDIHVYGNGDNIGKIKKNPNKIKYMGTFTSQEKNKIINQYLFSISTSKFEGMPFQIVESICSGTPIIIPNSFDSAEFLIDKENNGMIYNKKLSAKKLAKKINCFIDNMTKEKYEWYRNNCLNFANNNLTKKQFKEKWINIINSLKD